MLPSTMSGALFCTTSPVVHSILHTCNEQFPVTHAQVSGAVLASAELLGHKILVDVCLRATC